MYNAAESAFKLREMETLQPDNSQGTKSHQAHCYN